MKSLFEGTGAKFQRPPQANSGREPPEKVTILRKKFSAAVALSFPLPANRRCALHHRWRSYLLRLQWRRLVRSRPGPSCSELPAEPSDQSAPLQHGRRAHRRLDLTLLRRFCCAISRRHYDQFGAFEPGLGLARPFWRSKELRARQSLHDLPPRSARGQPTTSRDRLSDTFAYPTAP